MGLDTNGARFLLYCKSLGVDFARTATIGRQSLRMSKRSLKDAFDAFGYSIGTGQVESIFHQADGYAEHLLNYLGAEEVHSFDNSAYERATHLHDMNRELPDQFKQQYTAVLDGGSLEHIFNFPVAIRNCMEMVTVAGHYLAITPANNFFGHGFYQFSPELYFSVFSRENGFELVRVLAFEDWPDAKWYCVRSPVEAGGRITLTNSAPVYLLVVAKKIAHTDAFKTTPQQSDYLALWREQGTSFSGKAGAAPCSTSRLATCADSMKRILPAPLKRLILRLLRRSRSGFDPRYFCPMDPTVVKGSPAS
jgi:hypothetical protein